MRIRTRNQWGFSGPLGPAKMGLPSRGLWLHHSVTNPTRDYDQDTRLLERIGKNRFGRLSYSWAYHVGGRVFLQGQGNHIGAHTRKQNSTSHGLVVIGDYSKGGDPLPAYVPDDIAKFIDHGASQGWWEPNILGGHSDNPYSDTTCPGRVRNLIDEINQRLEEGDMPLSDRDIERIWKYRDEYVENNYNMQFMVRQIYRQIVLDDAAGLADSVVESMGEDFAEQVVEELSSRLNE